MTVPGSANPLLLRSAAPAGYQISRSLRFDSASLSRTPASSGSLTRWTWAGWVKKSGQGLTQGVFGVEVGAIQHRFGFKSDEKFEYLVYNGSFPLLANKVTTQVFRDPSAWFHLVVVWDSANSTASDRMQIYVNGQRITTFDASTDPTSSLSGYVNSSSYQHYISNGFSGYLADIHFIDGQALTPTSFAETNATTGQWVPKAYTGSYGTNGFRLDFSDNSAATATTLGKDRAGSNNWTPSGLSVTAGAGNDSLTDTPSSYGTDTGAGGEVRGNYCTWNPLTTTSTTLSDGNLQTSGSGGSGCVTTFVVPSSGKYYCEVTITTTPENGQTECVGVGPIDSANELIRVHNSAGQYYNGSSWVSLGSAWSINDVIGIGLNADTGQISFYRNGTVQGSAQSYSFTSKDCVKIRTRQSGTSTFVANFGQRQWAYAAPAGFKALSDTNLPAPTIATPSTMMDVKLYTGNGSTQTISGLGFSPDLVWIKTRSNINNNFLFDIIRGPGNYLLSDGTNAEGYSANTLTAFNADGFSTGSNTDTNGSGRTFVAWTWDAGSSTVTNTQGSITSSVRANASAGFSIVTFTAPSSGNFTVGHGLGVAPQLLIIKGRDSNSSGYDWRVFHSSVCDTVRKALSLNGTGAVFTSGSDMWGSALPTSTVFGATANNTVGANGTAVAYAFSPVAGYSSFGSYTGNGSADGPFVFCNFRPRWILVKNTASSTSDWFVWDTARSAFNTVQATLFANLSIAEQPTYISGIDVLSNGFKLRDSAGGWNGNGQLIIYAAFAESPFQYARAR